MKAHFLKIATALATASALTPTAALSRGSAAAQDRKESYQLRSVANREFLKDMVEMNFDSAFGDGELSCDLFV